MNVGLVQEAGALGLREDQVEEEAQPNPGVERDPVGVSDLPLHTVE